MKVLRQRTDKLCSLLARYKTDHCVTCGKKLTWKNRQWAHCIPRAVLPLRWSPLHEVQDARCNLYLNGNYGVYALYIIKKHGLKTWEDMVDVQNKWYAGKIKAPTIKQTREIYNDRLCQVRKIPFLNEQIPKSWREE